MEISEFNNHVNITNVVVLEIYFLGLYIGELDYNISYINISLQSYSRRISVLPTLFAALLLEVGKTEILLL